MKKLILLVVITNLILGCSNTKNNELSNFEKIHLNSSEAMYSQNENYILAKGYENTNDRLYIEHVIKAAEEGDPIAQNELANNYAFGEKVEHNSELFVLWAERSALQGYTIAQLNLGTAYYLGVNGLNKDNIQAKKWLSMAAQNGDETAKQYLSEIETVDIP